MVLLITIILILIPIAVINPVAAIALGLMCGMLWAWRESHGRGRLAK
jgi:hypothetical protein